MYNIKKRLLSVESIKNSMVVNIIYIFYYLLRSIFYALRVRCSLITLNSLKRFKSSDTLVILGAGSSLNDLSCHNWQELMKYDIAGTTSTSLLNIKQTYYFHEAPKDDETLKNFFTSIYSESSQKYKNGLINIMIWKNPRFRKIMKYYDMSRFKCLFFSDLLCDDESSLQSVLRFIIKTRFYKIIFLQSRASIFSMAWMGATLGYKKIIFCGVDLGDSQYFYEESGYNLKNVFDDPTAPHKTNLVGNGLPVELGLKCLSAVCTGSKFYVASPKSKLTSIFTLWRFK